MKKEIRAVIFDKDGVLLDSEKINVQSAIRAFTNLGIKLSKEDEKQVFGKHPEDYKHYFLKKYNFQYDKFRLEQRKIYHELYESVKPNQIIINLLKNLHKHNVRLALVTSSSRESTKKTLEKLNILNLFEVIVTFDDVKNRKPHPEPYLRATEILNIAPSEAIVFEDSPPGVESAKRAGIKCIALETRYINVQELSKADLISNSESEITNYLKKLGVKT